MPGEDVKLRKITVTWATVIILQKQVFQNATVGEKIYQYSLAAVNCSLFEIVRRKQIKFFLFFPVDVTASNSNDAEDTLSNMGNIFYLKNFWPAGQEISKN